MSRSAALLQGPNGARKTTTNRILLGLLDEGAMREAVLENERRR